MPFNKPAVSSKINSTFRDFCTLSSQKEEKGKTNLRLGFFPKLHVCRLCVHRLENGTWKFWSLAVGEIGDLLPFRLQFSFRSSSSSSPVVLFLLSKVFSVNWVLLLTAHLFLFEEREKIPFIFQFPLPLQIPNCTKERQCQGKSKED